MGSGFTSANFANASHALRYATTRHLGPLVPTIRWIAEPGRFFVQDAFYLACRVLGTRHLHPGRPVDVYVNDSIYKNFVNVLVESPAPNPVLLSRRRSANDHSYEANAHDMSRPALCTVWGETCCGLDRIRVDYRFTRRVQIDAPGMRGECMLLVGRLLTDDFSSLRAYLCS